MLHMYYIIGFYYRITSTTIIITGESVTCSLPLWMSQSVPPTMFYRLACILCRHMCGYVYMYICFTSQENYYYHALSFFYSRANWVKVNGTKYQPPCAIVVGKTEEEEPLFGSINKVLVFSQEVYFEFELMEANFCQHYHAYTLSSSHQHFLVKQNNLINYHPYGLYHCPNISRTSLQFLVLRTNIYAV